MENQKSETKIKLRKPKSQETLPDHIHILDMSGEKEQVVSLVAEKAKRGITMAMVPAERERILKENVYDFNNGHALCRINGKVSVLIEEEDEFGNPSYCISSESDFYLTYKWKKLRLPKVKRDHVEWEDKEAARLWLEQRERRFVNRIVFKPNNDHGPTEYNIFKGFKAEPAADFDPENPTKGCDLIIDLMRRLAGCTPDMPDTYAYQWQRAWFANSFQFPSQKPGTAIVWRSKEGAGKGTFMNEVIGAISGSHYVHIGNRKHLTSNFNTMLQGALHFFLDEAVWAGDKEGEGVLKYLITEPTVVIEGKFANAFKMANLSRIVFASNEKWVVPVGPTGRRYACFDCDESIAKDTEYFARVREQIANGGLEYFLAYMLNFDLTEWHDKLREPPMTDALVGQKIQSMRQDTVASWWFERLLDGEVFGEDDSKADGEFPRMITREAIRDSYGAYCKKMGVRYPASAEELGKRLREDFGAGEARTSKKVLGLDGKERRPMLYTFIAPNEDDAVDANAHRVAHFRGIFERLQFGGAYEWPTTDFDEVDADGTSLKTGFHHYDKEDQEIPY